MAATRRENEEKTTFTETKWFIRSRRPSQPHTAVVVSMRAGQTFEVARGDARTVVDTSYSGVKAGLVPDILRELERAEVLSPDDIHMIISERTLERRLSKRERLKLEESDGIARLLRVIAHANRVFEDEELAEEWLRSPNPALDDEVPMSMARTDVGAREVEGVLSRIEHGIFD